MHAVVRFISSTEFFCCSQVGEGRSKKSVLCLVIKYVLVLKIISFFFPGNLFYSLGWIEEKVFSLSLSHTNFKLKAHFCLRSY